MNKEKISAFTNLCILIMAVLALGFIGLKYVLPIALPFLIAWLIAFAVRRPADFIAAKVHIGRKISRPVLSVLLILGLLGGMVFLVIRVATEGWQLVTTLSEDGRLAGFVSMLLNPFDSALGNMGMAPELEAKLTDAISGLFSQILSGLASVITAVAGSIPKILLFLLITAISSVYFSVDFERINAAVLAILPKKLCGALEDFRNAFLSVFLKYLRSYLLIMLLTFSVMIFGLSILRAKYALLMAIIIALLDLLPVIGIGTVLVPWSIFMFISGDVKMGVGLLVLFAVAEIIRQIAEPKIFGMNLGIHPLLTLVLMYVGYSVFGIFGLILLPAFSIVFSVLFAKAKTAEVK